MMLFQLKLCKADGKVRGLLYRNDDRTLKVEEMNRNIIGNENENDLIAKNCNWQLSDS
jgi:hypothetical protein